MSIDLIQIADELHGIPDSETKISVPCSVHGGLSATITLTPPDKLVPACEQGCEPKALWASLVNESATLARLWAEKKNKGGDANGTRQAKPGEALSGTYNARAAGEIDRQDDPNSFEYEKNTKESLGNNRSSFSRASGSANESQRKEEGAYKGASGPGAEVKHDNEKSGFSQQPPRPETQQKKPRWKLANAVAYARHGMRVFPCHSIESDGYCSCGGTACKSAGKHPRIKDWQILATCDEAEIHKWWQQWPDSNVGVACGQSSNLTVLDVDGDAGRETLRALELEHGELPETPIAITGSGGAHYYFAFQRGPNNAVRFAPGLDIRTEGGLVVGVGSRNGKGSYEWEAAFTLGSSGLLPAVMPGWLVETIAKGQGSQASTNGALKVPDHPIAEGEGRNNTCYRLTRSLKAKGLPDSAIRAAVSVYNQEQCKPPLSDYELNLLLNNALRQPDRIEFQNGRQVAVRQQPAVIPWEGFEAAVAANQAYLSRTPVVEKLCFASAVSMITGGKHAGKSTLARWMAICVAKGWPFLKREVVQGPVCYIASEDETMPARQELIRLGWAADDPLRFLSVGESGFEDRLEFLEALTRDIKEQGTTLVILDMLFDFVDIADEMSYAGTREALGRIQRVATETKAHIVTIHHAPKHAQGGDAAIAALGSQGLAARVSPIILVRRFGPGVHSVISTNVRDPRGAAIEESRLTLNKDGSVTLGGAWKTYMLAEAYSPRVLEFLQAEEGAESTVSDVVIALDIAYEVARACLSSLWKGGFISRAGSGKKGQPYRYSAISSTNGKEEARPQGPAPFEGNPNFGYRD